MSEDMGMIIADDASFTIYRSLNPASKASPNDQNEKKAIVQSIKYIKSRRSIMDLRKNKQSPVLIQV